MKRRSIFLWLSAFGLLGYLFFARWGLKEPTLLPQPAGKNLSDLVRAEQGLQASNTIPPSLGTSLAGEAINDLEERRVAGIVVHAFIKDSKGGPAFLASEAVTDQEGKYSMNLAPGVYLLRWYLYDSDLASPHSALLGSTSTTVADHGASAQDLHFELPPTVLVQGIVRNDTTSEPVADADVFIFKDLAEWDPRHTKPEVYERVKRFVRAEGISTGKDGCFRVQTRLLPGKYWIDATHPQYKPHSGKDEGTSLSILTSQKQTYSVTIPMSQEIFVTMKGKVFTRSGQPVRGALITVRSGSLETPVESGSDGDFQFTVNPDTCSLTLRHAEYRTVRQDLGDPNPELKQGLTRELSPIIVEPKEMQVSVRIRDESGAPVPLQTLAVAEADLRTRGEVNPFFLAGISSSGQGEFRVDRELLYSFHLPEGSPWRIQGVDAGPQDVRKSGAFNYQFLNSNAVVTLTLRKK